LPERIVQVKLVVDARLPRETEGWQKTVKQLWERVSDYYQEQFAIRLRIVAIEGWDFRGTTPFISSLMLDLKERAPRNSQKYDLTVGLTRQKLNVYRGRGRVDRIGDCEEGLGSYVVGSISAPSYYYRQDDLENDSAALIHEIGHVFGAEHSDDADSIMHQQFRYRTEFDRKNREVILRNRLCEFR
jgi:hypothetical protein